MNVIGHSCFGYLEQKWKFLAVNFLILSYYKEFYKITLRHVKTTTIYLEPEQELHSDEMFHKACAPLGNIFWQ